MSNFYDSVNNSPAPQNSGRFKVNKTALSPARREIQYFSKLLTR